jgi:hypothetical protein
MKIAALKHRPADSPETQTRKMIGERLRTLLKIWMEMG